LSLTDWAVLGLVAQEPRHGFSVARELAPASSLGQVWTVRRPLVYRAIEHLADARLIEPTRTERGDQGPNRTVYRATRAGRARLRRWLDTPVDHPRDVRTELLVKFALLANAGRPLRPLAERQRSRFAPVAASLAHSVDLASGAERVVARWRLESTRAITRTLDAVIADEPA
jgi:DNA-binding PadR family transcriptional regulator